MSQFHLVKNKSMKILGDRTWTADLYPVLKRIPFIPASVGTLCPAFKFKSDSIDSTHDSSCREIFAKAFMSEYERWISTGSLTILAEEKCSKQSCHPSLRTFLKNVQQPSHATSTTMFFNLPDRSRTPISMPSCQTDLLQDAREFVQFHMANGTIGSMLFVSAFMDCSNEVTVDGVEVDVLVEIHLLTGETQGNKVVQKRLSCDFCKVFST